METLNTLLYELKNRPVCLLPKYAESLQQKIEKYLAGDLTIERPTVGINGIEGNYPSGSLNTYEAINGVAVIEINGIIAKRLGLPQEILDFFGLVDLDNIDAQLKQVKNDDTVNAVVLSVTSPGGFVQGLVTTGNLINELSKTKETVVFSDLVNASAAYHISSQANVIIGSQDLEIGSVGVYTTLVSMNRMLTEAGIDAKVIQAGTFKAIGHPVKPIDQASIDFIQNEVNETYEQFKAIVNKKRKINDAYLQGQTFSGLKALEYGFLDGFADDIETVISALTQK